MRQRLLAIGICTAALAAMAAAVAAHERGGRTLPGPGSTLERTLVDRDGDGVLETGPGEALAERSELAPAGRVARPLVTLVQLSDIQLTDEESPLRAEPLDRIGGPVASAFRPQEALTAQVLAAALRSAAAVRPDWLLASGDLVDNAQSNELDWTLRLLDGRTARPDSGAPGYDGLQRADNGDPFLYRPDIDAPRHPGLLAAAQRPVAGSGRRIPWLPAVSNHDLLVQGVVPADPALAAVALGDRKTTRFDPQLLDSARRGALQPADATRLVAGGAYGESRPVAPDAARRPLAAGEVVARLAAASGVTPLGDRLVYERALAAQVRLAVLDTADRRGGAAGVLPPDQVRWLQRALAAHPADHWLVLSPTPLEETTGGKAALAVLDAAPNVVAVLSGDTHRNRIRARPTARGGYWLVRTASLVDYPQQARALRLCLLEDGRVALETWMLDHAGATGAGGALGLAGISRDLAFLDVQGGRPRGWAGQRGDRNARLYLPR